MAASFWFQTHRWSFAANLAGLSAQATTIHKRQTKHQVELQSFKIGPKLADPLKYQRTMPNACTTTTADKTAEKSRQDVLLLIVLFPESVLRVKRRKRMERKQQLGDLGRGCLFGSLVSGTKCKSDSRSPRCVWQPQSLVL